MENYKSVGIVAEYNPFHKGHEYQLNLSKEITGAEVAVVAMSGNFTQRGNAAIFDKWTRAEMALAGGADLVVEIPTVFACNSAGYFASSGVEILENLGVDYISFGSEAGDITLLKKIANCINENNIELEEKIKDMVRKGLSYPRARHQVMKAYLSENEIEVLENPNNILGLEYLKYMKKAEAVTVKRKGADYHELKERDGLASATFLRDCLKNGEAVDEWIPSKSLGIINDKIKKSDFCTMDKVFPLLVSRIITSSIEELELAFAGGEGLGNKVKNVIRKCNSYEELVESLKSKRYTRTRIERFLAHILLNIKEDDVREGLNYVRILGFSDKGAKYLKTLKKAEICQLPIITNVNKDIYPEIEKTLGKDMMAADIYNLAISRSLYSHCDLVETVRRIKVD